MGREGFMCAKILSVASAAFLLSLAYVDTASAAADVVLAFILVLMDVSRIEVLS
jgi:hypothetical protein